MAKNLTRVDNSAIYKTTILDRLPNQYNEIPEAVSLLIAIGNSDLSNFGSAAAVVTVALDSGNRVQCFGDFNLDFDISEAIILKFCRYGNLGYDLDFYVLRDQLIRFHDALQVFQVEAPAGVSKPAGQTADSREINDLKNLIYHCNRKLLLLRREPIIINGIPAYPDAPTMTVSETNARYYSPISPQDDDIELTPIRLAIDFRLNEIRQKQAEKSEYLFRLRELL